VKILLIILLLPVTITAQTIDPVISKEYLDRIKNGQPRIFYTDTTNSAKNAFFQLTNSYNGYPIQKIHVKNGYLRIRRAYSKTLFLSGYFNSTIAIKSVNHLPELQDEYVQGRSQNGNLIWGGAETNEQFSYGPSINSLEYDGSNYLYDVNGRLVPIGSGNGRKVTPYSNSIFRTGSLLSQSLVLQARYAASGTYTTKLKLGQSDEQTVIKKNRNASADFSLSQDVVLRGITINASFTHAGNRFSNSNRNGFLNRIYQNSLLTPTSFENTQGYLLANDQRRYSVVADNPFFLLEDNGNSFTTSHNIGSLALEKKFNKVKFKILQSAERTNEKSGEGYKPTSAFFPNGIFANRKKRDASYHLYAGGSVDVRYGGYDVRSTANFNYAFTGAQSHIDYRTHLYNYKRSSHDVNINYLTTINKNNIDAGIRVGNKLYASNTSLKNDFFLPEASVYTSFNNIFNANGLFLKLASNYVEFNSELPLTTSFAQYELTTLPAGQAFRFFPVTEVKSFHELLPVRHKEWTARAELSYKHMISLSAEVFDRKTNDDIFPLYENGELILKNLADHRNKGIEIILSYTSGAKKLMTNHTVSLSTYNDVVTSVENGFDFTPVSGFSNVHKAIVNGKPLGAIVGNRFLRDPQNNIIIGSNGFPLIDPINSVIGDPAPDFIFKTNNSITWKKFSFSLDCEWKKGGDIWNGTQAVLDYFGRSKISGLLRSTTGYIFPGVLADGHVNNIPVSFYDPNLAVAENRWVRYGYTGVAEEYIQKADYIRINNLALSYKLPARKYIQTISFALYANNLLIWSAYNGADQNQLLYDQSNTTGLDFFNIPSSKSFGCNVSIQF
jgi:hypothetical protein